MRMERGGHAVCAGQLLTPREFMRACAGRTRSHRGSSRQVPHPEPNVRLRVVECDPHARATADVAAPGRRGTRRRLGRRGLPALGVAGPVEPLASESRPADLLQPAHPHADVALRAVPGALLDRPGDPPDRRLRGLRRLGHPLHAGLGGGPRRDGDLPGDDGLRAHVVRPAALRDPEHVVGAAVRRAQRELFRGRPRRLARARLHVPDALDRRRDRDGARQVVPTNVVDRGRARLRRYRDAADVRRPLPARGPLPRVRRSPACRGRAADPARGGALGDPGPGTRRPLATRRRRMPSRPGSVRAGRSSSSTRSSRAA